MAFITYSINFGSIATASPSFIDTNFGQVNSKFGTAQRTSASGPGQTAQNAIPICDNTVGYLQGFGRIRLGGQYSSAGIFGSTTFYIPLMPITAQAPLVETNAQMISPIKMTVQVWTALVTANTANFYTVLKLRVNGADATTSYSFAPGVTGTFSAYAPSNINVGDLVNWQLTTQSGTGFITIPQITLWCAV